MDAIVKGAALSLTVLAMACGGKSTQSASNGMDAGLAKDLQLASSPNLELASTAREHNKQMVVSDIERTPGSAPVKAATKAKAPPKPAAPTRTPTVVQVQSPTPAPPPTVVAQATTEAPAPDPEPSAAPRPEPPSVTYPTIPSTEGTQGRGGNGGLGGIIGVVIRGGVMDGDHCDPRGTMGRRGGIAINSRLPMHPTFPIPR